MLRESEMGELQVSLSYPSTQSLPSQFSDEKYVVVESESASNALYRRVPTEEEFAERGNSWSTTSEENQTGNKSAALSAAANEEMDFDLVSKKGSCWSQLKHTEMMQWGKRRPVRFLGRHEKNNLESLSGSVREQNERQEMADRKRKRGEEMEIMKEETYEVKTTTRKGKRNQNEHSEVQGLKKAQQRKQNQLVVYNKKKRKISIDRWSAERYKLAEENMLKVMKAKGAVFGKPILRPALRSEARKLIGDTGLLDHLLKHMAGKVAPGGTERFRRRHNAEGAMEYWLESADLLNIRREAGVQDPYWTPPPGWKLGDHPSQDPICARELQEIKQEMSKLKHDVQQLVSKKREEELAIVTTANSCLSNNLNLDSDGSLVTVQEMYKELVNKKSKIEEQLKDISQALSDLEEHMVILKATREEPTFESVTPPALLPAPGRVAVAVGNGGETKEEGGHKNKEKKDKAAKIERLKSGFRICKPQGTFIWPKMAIMSPQDQDVVPTPSSASSSSFVPDQAEPPPPKPSSPVKPLAERRPVSHATLTHVTMSFSHCLSPSPLGNPPTPTDQNPPLINLNEAPPSYDHSLGAALSYAPSLAPMQPRCPAAAEKEATEKKEKEMGNSSSSSVSVSDKKGWWNII